MSSGLEVGPTNLPEHYTSQEEKQYYYPYPHSPAEYSRPLPAGEARHEISGIPGVATENGEGSMRKRGLNAHPTWLAFVAALVTAVVVGAAVGGGLGNSLGHAQRSAAQCSRRLASAMSNPGTTSHSVATSTPDSKTSVAMSSSLAAATTTGGLLLDYTMPPVDTIYSIRLDCPAIDGTTHTTSSGYTFAISCKNILTFGDITAMRAYTLEDCIEACSNNNLYGGTKVDCTGATFIANIINSASRTDAYSNCFIKDRSATPSVRTQEDNESTGLVASAQLTGPYPPDF